MRNVNRMANTNKQQCTTNLLFDEWNEIRFKSNKCRSNWAATANGMEYCGSGGAYLGLKSIRSVCRSIARAYVCVFVCARLSEWWLSLVSNFGVCARLNFFVYYCEMVMLFSWFLWTQNQHIRFDKHMKIIDYGNMWECIGISDFYFYFFFFSSFAFTKNSVWTKKSTDQKTLCNSWEFTYVLFYLYYLHSEDERNVCDVSVCFFYYSILRNWPFRRNIECVWQMDVQLMAVWCDEWVLLLTFLPIGRSRMQCTWTRDSFTSLMSAVVSKRFVRICRGNVPFQFYQFCLFLFSFIFIGHCESFFADEWRWRVLQFRLQ